VAGDGRAGIDAALVRRLIAAQFPQWRDLPVRPVDVDGWDNRTYRLGGDMTVRLPTHESYAPAIDKEHRWLPVLAPQLPVPIPTPLAKGAPAEGYPFSWSIRRWISGRAARPERIADLPAFAVAVGEFLLDLRRVDATGGPHAGAHSFYRGAPPAHYDQETREALARLGSRIDAVAAQVWDAALTSRWAGPPTWFHGDVAAGNLLVRAGRLAGVIDFGTSGVGDPACDLVIAWTFFAGESRAAFRSTVGDDAGTWARARGWALWKALISLPGDEEVNRRIIDDVIGDHRAAG
jgi:aminoglycoside phosphotransferase (APT) family kinase protein